MKNQLLNLKMIALMCLMMVLGGANVWAESKTYNYTFKSGDFSAKKLSSTLNGVTWTLNIQWSSSTQKYGWDDTQGLKFGTNTHYPKAATLSTSELDGTITSIVVNTSGNSKTTAKLDVTVGGKAFGKQQSLTGNAQNLSFNGSASGQIELKYSNSNCPIYIKSIAVTYETAPAKTLTSLAISGQPTKNIYNEGELFDPAGIKVMALYEGETDQVDVTSNATLDYDKTPLAVGTTQMEVKASLKEKVATQTFDITVNELPKYDITATAAVGGSYTVKIGDGDEVSVPAEGATYKSLEGKKVVMTIAAADGYKTQSTPFEVETYDNKSVSVSKSGTSYSFTMPAKAVTITAKFSKLYNITKGVCEHGTITIENSNTEVSQAVKGNKIVVTATPDEHYDLSGMYYVVSGSDEHVSISGNSFTMPENDVTVYATFTEKAKYQVTWITNGTEAKKEFVYSDATVGSEAPEAAKVEGYSFMGWTTTALTEATNVAPVYVSLTDNKFMPEADVTLYAVYAVATEGGTEERTSTLSFEETVSSPYENAGATWTFENCTFATEERPNNSGFTLASANATVKLPQGAIVKKYVVTSTGNSWSRDAKVQLLGASENLIKESNKAISYDFTSDDNSEGSYTLKNASSRSAWIKSIAITFDATAYTYSGYCTTVGTAAAPTYTAQTLTFIAKDGSTYYSTFSSDKVTFFPEASLIPCAITVANGKINQNDVFTSQTETINNDEVPGYYIPANTGVMFMSDAADVTYYTVENKTVDALAEGTNMLMPAPVAGGVFGATADYMYYKLAYGDWTNKTQLGFYWGAEEGGAFYVKAGTAYLAVPKANAAGAKGFTLNGEATGIEGVNANVENAKAIYNLNGQRVASMAKPGLYIVNGKKVVRK